MAFFPSSSGFIINGGNFMSFNFQTEDPVATQILGKGKSKDSEGDNLSCRSRILDGLMILKAGDIELCRELISDSENSYRIHAASHGGRLVAVKTFEGPRAKQDWEVNVAFSKKCLHPNVLQIVGISDESSENHFIQYHGITSEQKMQWLIASSLGTDLNTSVELSMKAVKGIAAGLSYIKSQKIPVMYAGTINNNQKWDNFDILTGYDNEPIIVFHLPSTVFEDRPVSQNLDIKTDSRGIELLNGLCHQLFSGANSILYDDSPEREFDVYDSEDCSLKHQESTSNLSEIEAISNRSDPMKNPKPRRKPRREVWWLDLGTTNHSLMSVGRCFEERLNWSLLSSSNSLLRHIKSPKDDNLRRTLHQCPGYLREEIALTCDLSKSVIVSHTFPGPSERCSICHQLVQYTYSDSYDHNNLPMLNNSSSLAPTEGALTFNHVDFSSGHTPDSSTPFPDHVDPANQQTQQQQHPTTHVLASSDANNNQATLRLQLGKISRLGSLIFGKNAKRGLSDIFGGGKSHQVTIPLEFVDETFPAVSFPSRSNAQSSSTGSRSMSESSPTHDQQLPLQDLRETRKINKKEAEAERLHREAEREKRKLAERRLREAQSSSTGSTASRSMSESSPIHEQQLPSQDLRETRKINKKEDERLHREAEWEKRRLAERRLRQQAREVLFKRQKLMQKGHDVQSFNFTAGI